MQVHSRVAGDAGKEGPGAVNPDPPLGVTLVRPNPRVNRNQTAVSTGPEGPRHQDRNRVGSQSWWCGTVITTVAPVLRMTTFPKDRIGDAGVNRCTPVTHAGNPVTN